MSWETLPSGRTLLVITLLWEHSVLGGAPCLESVMSGEILAGQYPTWGAPCLRGLCLRYGP